MPLRTLAASAEKDHSCTNTKRAYRDKRSGCHLPVTPQGINDDGNGPRTLLNVLLRASGSVCQLTVITEAISYLISGNRFLVFLLRFTQIASLNRTLRAARY